MEPVPSPFPLRYSTAWTDVRSCDLDRSVLEVWYGIPCQPTADGLRAVGKRYGQASSKSWRRPKGSERLLEVEVQLSCRTIYSPTDSANWLPLSALKASMGGLCEIWTCTTSQSSVDALCSLVLASSMLHSSKPQSGGSTPRSTASRFHLTKPQLSLGRSN